MATGTIDDPVIISSIGDWHTAIDDPDGYLKHYRLGRDIDARGEEMRTWFWSGGTISDRRFAGSLDFHGYTISNGMFAHTSIGDLRSSTSLIFWPLPAALISNGRIYRCVFSASSANTFTSIASLCYQSGATEGIAIEDCDFDGITTAAPLGASLYGSASRVEITGCRVSGADVAGFNLVKNSSAQVTLENCYSRGNVLTGTTSASGFISTRDDNANKITINNSYAANTLNAPNKHGFCLNHTQTVELGSNVFWDTTVSGSTAARTGAVGLTTAQMQDASQSATIRGLLSGAGAEVWQFEQGKYPSFTPSEPAYIPVTDITLSESTTTVRTELTVLPSNATNKGMAVEIDKPIADVSIEGSDLVIALKESGSATVTVRSVGDPNIKATFGININAQTNNALFFGVAT